MSEEQRKSKIRVCIIGGGAAGLCAVKHFSNDDDFEPAVFEQSEKIGGTWIYNEKTGNDPHGFPIHSSMYKNLRTNIPLKLMNFPDFQRMQQTRPSCGSHEQVLDYLNKYADHFNLRRFIQFNTQIICVKPIERNDDWRLTTWNVKVKNYQTNNIEDKIFDAIVVSTGHYSEPKIPLIPGIESYSGHLIHSHDYREPKIYSGKIVIVLGAGPSGIDIAIEISKFASTVYLSHNEPRLASELPPNVSQVAGVQSVNGNKFTLKDGNNLTASALLLCTGYKFSFPFFHENCKIRVDDNFVSPLYKKMINVEHPTMCILGVMSKIIPFIAFHVQVQYFLKLLKGSVQLPSKEVMLAESVPKIIKKESFIFGDSQWAYYDDLADLAGVEKIPEFYKNGYTEWSIQKTGNLLTYKDSEIIIEEDGKTVHIILNPKNNN